MTEVWWSEQPLIVVVSAYEITYIVSSGALNSTHSLLLLFLSIIFYISFILSFF